MGVNLIFKIAAVGILVSVICQVLKHSGREEQAFLTSLAGLVLVLLVVKSWPQEPQRKWLRTRIQSPGNICQVQNQFLFLRNVV